MKALIFLKEMQYDFQYGENLYPPGCYYCGNYYKIINENLNQDNFNKNDYEIIHKEICKLNLAIKELEQLLENNNVM